MIETVDLASPDAAARLESALVTTGFVELVGHGLGDDGRSELRRMGDRFFARSHDEKTAYVHEDPAANRGYRSRGSEALSYSLGEASPPDLFESFNCAPDPGARAHALRQPTPWPDDLVPGFSTAAIAAFEDFAQLAARLDSVLGDILGLDWLAASSGAGPDMLASINYRPEPDGSEATVDGQQRMGAHSDYTTFTLLDADPVAGLQIVSPAGEWVDICPSPGALLMNVGDLLAMLTNDAWPSTLHRVVPMHAGAEPFRRSVAFFHYPNLDVEIAPIEGFVTPDQPARYEPVTVEDHLLGKLLSPKIHKAATGASTAAGRPTS